MSTLPCVLIVDESDESREVLKMVLQRSGTEVLEANRATEGAAMARRHRPDVIVFDVERRGTKSVRFAEDFDNAAGCSPTPIVVLGHDPRDAEALPASDFVAKPYHYGPLVRKIENLLARSA